MNAPAAVTEGWPLHARFEGPIVMIGFGSIGKGTLPLIERHIAFDRSKFAVVAPEDSDRGLLDERQIQFIHQGSDEGELSRDPHPAADRGARPRPVREPVGRHLLGRHHGAVQGSRRLLHRHRR